jgi:hypothetical protein
MSTVQQIAEMLRSPEPLSCDTLQEMILNAAVAAEEEFAGASAISILITAWQEVRFAEMEYSEEEISDEQINALYMNQADAEKVLRKNYLGGYKDGSRTKADEECYVWPDWLECRSYPKVLMQRIGYAIGYANGRSARQMYNEMQQEQSQESAQL